MTFSGQHFQDAKTSDIFMDRKNLIVGQKTVLFDNFRLLQVNSRITPHESFNTATQKIPTVSNKTYMDRAENSSQLRNSLPSYVQRLT